MRQLVPDAGGDAMPARAYATDARLPTGGRPWVVANMIASIDGATAVDGRSGGLGGPGDKTVFAALRAVADVILVAAGTVRAERYRPPAAPEGDAAAERRRRGQAGRPRLAIVSRRLDLDDDHPVLTGPEPPILITTVDAPADRLRSLGTRTKLLTCGRGEVDLGLALATLHRDHRAGVVLAEGGPSLNGALLDAGLVDELCLTVAPVLAGGPSARIVHGALPTSERYALHRVLADDGYLFLRYVRATPHGGGGAGDDVRDGPTPGDASAPSPS